MKPFLFWFTSRAIFAWMFLGLAIVMCWPDHVIYGIVIDIILFLGLTIAVEYQKHTERT